MRIHAYERLWLVGSMILIVFFIATVTYGSVGLGITMIDDREETLAPGGIDEDERFAEPRVEQTGQSEYEAYVVAMTFIYQPDPIEIPANSEVTFYITSRDVIHSFTVVGTNTNTMVIPGEVSVMTVEFDEPGEYGIVCNEYCGAGHHDMEAELVVVDEDEFDLTELSVQAPETGEAGNDLEFEGTVNNGLLDDHETAVSLEVGDVTATEDVTIEGEGRETVTFSVSADDLGTGTHEWTLAVDGESENGTVTIDAGAITETNSAETDASNEAETASIEFGDSSGSVDPLMAVVAPTVDSQSDRSLVIEVNVP